MLGNLLKNDKVKNLEEIIESLRYDKKSLQQTIEMQMEAVEEQQLTIQTLQEELEKLRRQNDQTSDDS